MWVSGFVSAHVSIVCDPRPNGLTNLADAGGDLRDWGGLFATGGV